MILAALLLAASASAAPAPAKKPAPKPAIPRAASPKTVSFVTNDGWKISASWRKAPKGRPTLVLAHGVAASRKEWDKLAAKLASRGIGTLAVDLRGHGESETGPGGAKGWQAFDLRRSWNGAVDDLRAAAWYLRSQGVPDASIAYGGASIGANLASIAASETNSAPFLVLLSPAEQYRGVRLTVRPGLKTLSASSQADSLAYIAVMRLRNENGATAVFAPFGHGAPMLDDAATGKAVEDWIAAAGESASPSRTPPTP